MKEADKNNLDNLLKNRFETFGEMPSPKVWENIDAHLSNKTNLWPLLFYCLTFLIGMSAGIVGFYKYSSDQNNVAKNNKKAIAKNNEKIIAEKTVTSKVEYITFQDSNTIAIITKMVSSLQGQLNSMENRINKQNRLLDQLNKTISYQNTVINNYYSSTTSNQRIINSVSNNQLPTDSTNSAETTNSEHNNQLLNIGKNRSGYNMSVQSAPVIEGNNLLKVGRVSDSNQSQHPTDFIKQAESGKENGANNLKNYTSTDNSFHQDSTGNNLNGNLVAVNIAVKKDSILNDSINKKDSVDTIKKITPKKITEKKEKFKFNHWDVEAAGGMGYAFRNLALTDSKQDTFYVERNKSETGKIKGWGGVFVTYKIKRYLGIKSGIIYTTYGEQFKMTKSNIVASNASYGQTDFTTQEVVYDMNTNKNYLGIPIMLQASLKLSDKFSLNAAAGICFQKLMSGTSILNTSDSYVTIDWKDNGKKLYKDYTQSFISQIKLGYSLADNLELMVGYQGNYFFNSISKGDGCIEERPNSNSLLLGIKIQL